MPTIGLFTQRPRGAAQSLMDSLTRLTPEGLLDFRGITAPTPGTLTGAPGTGGSPAAGQKPAVPDPSATQASALAGNLANLAKLRQLFNRTSAAVGVTPEMTAAESRNINAFLNPSGFIDINRMNAESGTARGIAGSPAAETAGFRRTDEEVKQRQILASQLLSNRADRANAILSPQNFMVRPETQQGWQYLTNMITGAADPEAAYRRAKALAESGIRQGFGAGYGGGAPRVSAPMGPGATYAGDVNWNNLTAARSASVPTWPTLPSFQGGGAPSAFAPPNSNAGEDWLSSLGLGLGQPGVTTTPMNNFMGDINVPEDLYS